MKFKTVVDAILFTWNEGAVIDHIHKTLPDAVVGWDEQLTNDSETVDCLVAEYNAENGFTAIKENTYVFVLDGIVHAVPKDVFEQNWALIDQPTIR